MTIAMAWKLGVNAGNKVIIFYCDSDVAWVIKLWVKFQYCCIFVLDLLPSPPGSYIKQVEIELYAEIFRVIKKRITWQF